MMGSFCIHHDDYDNQRLESSRKTRNLRTHSTLTPFSLTLSDQNENCC